MAPATLESFGLAALEARAAGLAIVARDNTGVTEFVQDGIDGLLADSDDEMSRHLAQLCLDPNRLRQMLRHNHLVRPVHGWTHVGELNTAAYRRAGAAVGALVSQTSAPEARPGPPSTHHDPWLLESAHTLAQSSAA